MRPKQLKLKDKGLFEKFLKQNRHGLSNYAFANIYIWKGLFQIFWAVINSNLCVFFKDKIATFMYLPPLGKKQTRVTLDECFNIMDGLNANKQFSRIENVEAQELDYYRGLGYECIEKSCDYVYKRKPLTELSGNLFKSKRADYNYFVKHYDFQFLPYSAKYKHPCIELLEKWIVNRQNNSYDAVYVNMLKDASSIHKLALDNHRKLGLIGMVVLAKDKLVAYTFGYRLNDDTFSVLFEIADLSIKGVAQFIFREFVQEAKSYKYINVMDDSGLENLRRVKMSYRPHQLIPAYIVQRKKDV